MTLSRDVAALARHFTFTLGLSDTYRHLESVDVGRGGEEQHKKHHDGVARGRSNHDALGGGVGRKGRNNWGGKEGREEAANRYNNLQKGELTRARR